MIVKVNNPYFDKTYKVIEGKGDIEYALKNIDRGNERFLHLHDYETGHSITISPAYCASIEFKTEREVQDADSN